MSDTTTGQLFDYLEAQGCAVGPVLNRHDGTRLITLPNGTSYTITAQGA